MSLDDKSVVRSLSLQKVPRLTLVAEVRQADGSIKFQNFDLDNVIGCNDGKLFWGGRDASGKAEASLHINGELRVFPCTLFLFAFYESWELTMNIGQGQTCGASSRTTIS
jgi:hypothetical protein